MDHCDPLRHYDEEVRRDAPAEGREARLERENGVLRHVAPESAGWHGVRWSDLTEATADDAVAAQLRAFAAYGRPFEWKVYGHDRPADLGARLSRAGFEPGSPETVMVAEAADVAETPRLPRGVRLREVRGPDDVELLVGVHEEVFGAGRTALRARLLDLLDGAPETVHALVATAGGRPVASARTDLPPGGEYAGLCGGCTLPDWRGRGLYRALVAVRARHAAERGHRRLHVDASDASRPVLERLGFRPLTTTTPYVHHPAGPEERR